MTLPSFLAASMSCGVIAVAGGAAARTLAEPAKAPTAAAVEPLRMSRLDNVGFFIGHSPSISSAEHAAAFGRKIEPDCGPMRNVFGCRGDHAQLRAVRQFHHIVTAGAEKHLPHHGSGH